MVCISQRGLSQATCFRLCVKLKRDRCHTTYRCDPPGSREMACDRPRDATNTEVGTDHERAGCCPMPCRVLAASRFDVERLESDFKHAEPRTHSSCCQSSSANQRRRGHKPEDPEGAGENRPDNGSVTFTTREAQQERHSDLRSGVTWTQKTV